MTPEQLAVERDALLQGGRTLEEVKAMQLVMEHPTAVADARFIAQWTGWMTRLRPGEQCPICRRSYDFRAPYEHQHNSRCDLVLASRRLATLYPPVKLAPRLAPETP